MKRGKSREITKPKGKEVKKKKEIRRKGKMRRRQRKRSWDESKHRDYSADRTPIFKDLFWAGVPDLLPSSLVSNEC